jgi:hypothetical protein
MSKHFLVYLDKIHVVRAEDFSTFGEPGDEAEWRLTIRIGTGYSRRITDDHVKDGDDFDLSDPVYVFVPTQGSVEDQIEVEGFEHDSSSANDVIPSIKIAIVDSVGAGPKRISVSSEDFEYELHLEVSDAELAPWSLVHPGGVLSGSGAFSGRPHAAAELPDGTLLLATQWGGVWHLDLEHRRTDCVTDDLPPMELQAMSTDNGSPANVLVGGVGVLLRSFGAGPLKFVAVPLPAGVTHVNAIEQASGGVLLATNAGLFWADYADAWGGSWTLAASGRFFDVRARWNGHRTLVVAGRWRANTTESTVMKGSFIGGKLTMNDVLLPPELVITVTTTDAAGNVTVSPDDYATVDVNASDTNLWFAAITRSNGGGLHGVGRSVDGGKTWSLMPVAIDDPLALTKTMLNLAGDATAGGGIRKIASDPKNPNRLMVPWKDFFVTLDATGVAPKWKILGGPWDAPDHRAADERLHADAHYACYLSDGRVALLTDGGVTILANDGGLDHTINLRLPTLLVRGPSPFDNPPWRGTLGVSPSSQLDESPAAVGMGLQDLGSAIANMKKGHSHHWTPMSDGDGGLVGMTPQGVLAQRALGSGGEIQFANWNPKETDLIDAWTDIAYVDMLGTRHATFKEDPRLLVAGVTEVMRWDDPTAAQATDPIAVAVMPLSGPELDKATRGTDNPATADIDESQFWIETPDVYGLTKAGNGHEWSQLARIPAGAGAVSGLGAYNGHILVGTVSGQLFELGAAGPAPLPIREGAGAESIFRITGAQDRWYAASSSAIFTRYDKAGNGFLRRPVSSLGIGSRVFGIEASLDPVRPVVLAATNTGVWCSADHGAKWFDAGRGLPKSLIPQDIRLAWWPTADDDKSEFAVLSTWGRSVWMTWLDALLVER